jgi:hypothetical protein
MAARQALRLCEAALPQGTGRTQGRTPPHIAATLRNRLRLIPEQEADR